jgi:predicted  nucleic acid-binding Zn-ribbon protein
MIDPMQVQFMYQTSSSNINDTQNQLSKLRILCSAKDRRISQLENLCEEYNAKYESEIGAFKHKIELTESKRKECFKKKNEIFYLRSKI